MIYIEQKEKPDSLLQTRLMVIYIEQKEKPDSLLQTRLMVIYIVWPRETIPQ